MVEVRHSNRNELFKNLYTYSGYNFCMILDGFKIGFQRVSGITLKNGNFSAYHEGGYNNAISIFQNEKKEFNKLVLEKGTGFFNPTKLLPKFTVMLLIAYDESHEIAKVYGFSQGTVSDIVVSEFNAMTSKVQIDTTTILYDTAFEIDVNGRQVSFVEEQAAKQEDIQMSEQARNDFLSRIMEHNAKIAQKKKEKNNIDKRKADLIY